MHFCFFHLGGSSIVYDIQGDLQRGFFSLNMGVGKSGNGTVPFSFPLLLDVSSSATMIPDVLCKDCAGEKKYDAKLSQSHAAVECTSDFCLAGKEDVCPNSHSPSGQCCDSHSQGLCMWDSALQFNTRFPASGGIIRDSIQMGDYTVDTYLVDVFESSSLPGQLEGILGLGEASCNPTCMPPIYQSILAAEHGSYKKEDMRFSVCFGRTAGKLYFDAYDPHVASSPAVVSYQRKDEIGYTFDLLDLRLNNQSFTGLTALGLNRVALLESAFSEIKLPRDLYDKLVAQLKADFAAAEGVADGSVFEGQGVATLEGYPTFDVKIPGALLHLPPQLYFVKKEGRFFLQIVANDFENTVQLGLAAMRGFVTEFQYEKVSFASVNPSVCGDDVDGAVGTVEWAEERERINIWNPVTLIAILSCVLMIALLVYLIRSNSGKKALPVGNTNLPTAIDPFNEQQQSLVPASA
ncbi:hypothetical protein WA556_007039 [Blastocystis sp. ATCC 50177/Nand II]